MNVKRTLLGSILLSALIGVGVAGAAGRSLVEQGYFGNLVSSRPDATINISGETKQIYPRHFETVKVQNEKGQSFVWQFSSVMQMSTFPLKAIAPSGFDAGDIMVSVIHPTEHFGK